MRCYSVIAFALLLCIAVGCGKGYVRMGGTVTFADDNTPLTTGTVIFDQGSHHARGTLDEQGRYMLGFGSPGSGLPKGTYNVYVIDAMVEDGTVLTGVPPATSERTRYRNLIDAKYNSAATSGLTVVVDGTTRTFDFSVERAKP